MSVSRTGEKNWAFGKTRTPEHSKKIGDSKRGKRIHTEEFKKNVSKRSTGNTYNLGRVVSEETKKKKSLLCVTKKPIICHENGKIYESISAAAKNLGILKKRITDVLNGRKKSYKGLTFSRVEVPNVI